jgi:tRNA nucleotidyltransferase/poly(A) polymerase
MRESGFSEYVNAYEKVLNLAQIIKENGGQALLVGGSVRDIIMEKTSKDFDVEVYGLESTMVEKLYGKLEKFLKLEELLEFLKFL